MAYDRFHYLFFGRAGTRDGGLEVQMRIAAAGIVFSTFVIAAKASDEPRWFGSKDEQGASLIYGIPQSGYGPLSFSCTRKGEPLRFSLEHEPVKAKIGVRVTVILAASGIEIGIPTVGQRLEMDDLFVLNGRVRLDDKLKRLLTSGKTLEVRVEDGAAEYPLAGAPEAARALFQHCG